MTIKEKENRLANLVSLKQDIEQDPDRKHPESLQMLKAYHAWGKLSDKDRQASIKAWRDYYDAVKESPIYALFQAQREAASKGDHRRLKDLASQARVMRLKGDHITLDKPLGIDPWEFNQGWVRAWLDCQQEIESLRKDLAIPEQEEAREIWEK